MKNQLLNLQSGKRGFVFSLDVIIAIFVVTSILAASTFYIAKAGEDSVSNLQAIKVGSDIAAVLDYDGTLDTLNVDIIEVELNRVLPINNHMMIRIECSGQDSFVVETTDIYPNDRFIGTGKRVFVTNTGINCIANFEIWLR